LTTDACTSPNSKSIRGVTGHWVDDENKLRELVLDGFQNTRSSFGRKRCWVCYGYLL